jgi:hypothetical protein
MLEPCGSKLVPFDDNARAAISKYFEKNSAWQGWL